VEQHHAWVDGSGGYPVASPCIGAQMLAIIDAYESITSPRPDRQYRRSVLQALTEINNNTGRQFSADLAPLFINIVRELMKQAPAS
jgi:HD-GYP domain-containing protein (c-di-GMP phosphodiesterase class II)